MLTVFLTGGLTEDHYLWVAAPALVLALSFARPLAAMTCTVGVGAMLFVPKPWVGHSLETLAAQQVRYVIGEVLLFLAATAFVLYPRACEAPRFWPRLLGNPAASQAGASARR